MKNDEQFKYRLDWMKEDEERITSAYKEMLDKKKKPFLRGQGEPGGIMFIGTNPGIASKLKNLWEDPYGKYFGKFLVEAGIEPNDIYVTNLYKYPTPENRPLNDEEIMEGWQELMLEIGYVSPAIIVAMGRQVQDRFGVNNGEIKNWKIYRVYGIHHPSYIRRNPNVKVDFINNLIRIKKIYDKKAI